MEDFMDRDGGTTNVSPSGIAPGITFPNPIGMPMSGNNGFHQMVEDMIVEKSVTPYQEQWAEVDRQQKAGEISYEEAMAQKDDLHAKAEFVRNVHGYSGGPDGSEKNYIADQFGLERFPGNNTTGVSSPATTSSRTVSSGSSSSGSKYSFTHVLEDDDDLQMDINAARQYIQGTMDRDLGDMCKNLDALVRGLDEMQGKLHSTSSTSVDEDYKDFESLTEALSDFLVECNRMLDDTNSYIDAVDRTLHN